MRTRSFSMRNAADRYFLGGLAVIAVLLHWRWFLPGVITDQDWWNYSDTAMRALWPFPSTYNFDANAGADWRTSINYFPMESIMGLLAHLGADFGMAERLAVLFPTVILAPVAAYFVLRLYCSRPAAAFVGALFYANNAYIDVIVARGQMTIAESYAMAPLVLYLAIRSARNPHNVRLPLATAMAFAAAVVFDVRIALLTACLTTVVVLFETSWSVPKALLSLRNAGLVLISCAGLLCFIWLPIVSLHLHEAPPLDYVSATWIALLTGPTVWDLLTAYHPLWYNNVFTQWNPFYAVYFLLLVIGLASLVHMRRKRIAICLAAIILVATLFAAAGNTPFGHVYEWLFVHSWFVGLFRDPSKFYAPAMLAYSLCIGVAATWLASLPSRRYTVAILVCASFVALFPTLPAATGQQDQLYLPKHPSNAERRLARELKTDQKFSRVLWAGATDRLVPGDYRHPAVDMLWFAGVAEQKHTVVQTAATFLRALRHFGVSYVVVRRDTGEGLDYVPNRRVYNTIRTYALFGVFGRPAWSMDGLTVFRLPNAIAAYRADRAEYALPTSTVPRIPAIAAGKQTRGAVVLARRSIIAGNDVLILPPNLYVEPGPLRYVRRRARTDDVLQNVGVVALNAVPPLGFVSVSSAARFASIRVPDWSGYIMLKLFVRRSFHGALTVRGRSRFAEHFNLRDLSNGHYYFTLPVQNVPKDLVIRSDDPAHLLITAAWSIPSDYYGLIEQGALCAPRRRRALPLDVPLAAALSRNVTARSMEASINISASPAELRATLPAEDFYTLPFAYTPLWTAKTEGTGVRRPAKAESLVEVKTGGREAALASAADPLLRKGAIVAFAVWLLLAVVLIAWKLRDTSTRTVHATVQHST